MHTQRLAMAISAGAGMLATFLPWANVPLLGAIPGTVGDGWFTFVFFGIVLILTLVGDKKMALDGKGFIGALVVSVLAGAFGLWKIIEFYSTMSQFGGDDPISAALGSSVSIGIGLYLVVVAAVAVIGCGFVLKGAKKA